jgi:hypothetical protein
MALKGPQAMMAIPIVIMVFASIIYNSAEAYLNQCANSAINYYNWSCQAGITIFSFGGSIAAQTNSTGSVDPTAFLGYLVTPNVTGLASLVTFVAGFLMFVLSFLGYISIEALASGVALGSGAQAQKFIQTVGVSMMILAVFTSATGGWYNVMPYGLGAFLYTILLIMFFIGMYLQAISGGGGGGGSAPGT